MLNEFEMFQDDVIRKKSVSFTASFPSVSNLVPLLSITPSDEIVFSNDLNLKSILSHIKTIQLLARDAILDNQYFRKIESPVKNIFSVCPE